MPRIAFDVTDETLEEIDALGVKAGVKTRADLVRNSFKLYSWFLEKEKEGYEVMATKEGEPDIVVVMKRSEPKLLEPKPVDSQEETQPAKKKNPYMATDRGSFDNG